MAVITYGDSLLDGNEVPLKTLHRFLTQQLGTLVSWVHVLPFHPWTSDDGFAVLDYSSVNEALGTWSDITRLGIDYRLMVDLVLNHCSSRSAWFENFRQGEGAWQRLFLYAGCDFRHPQSGPTSNFSATQYSDYYARRPGRVVHLWPRSSGF